MSNFEGRMEAPWFRGLKTTLYRFAPPLYYLARYWREATHQRREQQIQQHLRPIREAVQQRYQNVVQQGPFAGMRYILEAHGSPFLPKLIGSYEAELHAALALALGREPTALVDVGCAEGYYAVGLLRQCPGRPMFAYDIQPKSLLACQALAELNGVADRLTLREACTPAELQAVVRPGTLIVCDCEGYELDLLDPVLVPALRSADILVELHDHLRLDCALTPLLLDRFADTHTITRIGRSSRRVEDFPCLGFLPPDQRALALHEDRVPTQEWALLLANERTPSD